MKYNIQNIQLVDQELYKENLELRRYKYEHIRRINRRKMWLNEFKNMILITACGIMFAVFILCNIPA